MPEEEKPENNPAPLPLIPQPYPDSNQLENVAKEPERIPKDLDGSDRSLISLLKGAPKLRTRILELQKNHPELFNLDEPSFKRDYRESITLVTQRIRVSLWQEFEAAIQNNRLMKLGQIYAGTCGETTFYTLIDNPVRLAYILCPPADYIVMLKEAHSAGLEKLREIFTAQIVDEEGYMNPKAADMVLKAFALLDARLKGAIVQVQRVDQRVLTANITNGANPNIGLPADMDQLEIELAKTRKQLEEYTRIPRNPTPLEIVEETKDIKLTAVDMSHNQATGGRAKLV